MNDLSYPLSAPLTVSQIQKYIAEKNAELHAVRFWRSPHLCAQIRVLVKDNIGVVDFPTSAGSFALKDWHLPDAFCIRQLRKHPQIDLFGKTHLTELAGFVTSIVLYGGYSELGGFGRNPHGKEFPCRGSSSGSAIAVGAGLCDVALGTETRGSLMCPALANGVFGFKPTRGAISRSGVIPLSSHFDAVGLLARNLSVLSKVFKAMVGFDPQDPLALPSKAIEEGTFPRKSILVLINAEEEWQTVKVTLRDFFLRLENKGFRIQYVRAPKVEFDYTIISSLDIRRDMTEFLKRHAAPGIPACFTELVRAYESREHAHPYGMERLTGALKMSEMEPEALEGLVKQNVSRARQTVNRLLESYDADVLLSPSYIDWWSIGGGPSLALPILLDAKPPVGVMLGAKIGGDWKLLNMAQTMLE